MTLTLKQFKINGPNDIIDALVSLADIDADFNGENGEEYLWKVAKDAGYDTNATYLANTITKNNNDFESCVKEYVEEWIGKDYYYKDYDVKILKDKNCYTVALATID